MFTAMFTGVSPTPFLVSTKSPIVVWLTVQSARELSHTEFTAKPVHIVEPESMLGDPIFIQVKI